jgi:hypothetical protein
MRAMSNAFMKQIEVVQTDRWSKGPLELVFVPVDWDSRGKEDVDRLHLALHDWNQCYAAGHLRPADTFDAVVGRVPGIEHRANPNIILAPATLAGVSALHTMLASLLPDSVLQQVNLERVRASMGLVLWGCQDLTAAYVRTVEAAFSRLMWSKIAPKRRFRAEFFSARSPLRLLADDARFWMNRIYRLALDRRENGFSPVTGEDESWESMDQLQRQFDEAMVDEEDRSAFVLRRPLMGGTIWLETDAAEREAVLEDALTGAGVMESLEPVIELLQSERAHEDFSDRASWIKEDFERSFYSKRAKLKVELVETLDDAPVWSADECDGYGEVLFRDLVAALDVRERRLLLALRTGKTVTEIAAEKGLRCHASISRRVADLKKRVALLLQ